MRLIDLDELLKFPIRLDHYDKENGDEHFAHGVEAVLEYAENLPVVEAESVRHGQWIEDGEICGIDKYKCSLCGGEVGGLLDNTKYCCFCGAKMDLRTQTEAALDIADSVMMGGADNG